MAMEICVSEKDRNYREPSVENVEVSFLLAEQKD